MNNGIKNFLIIRIVIKKFLFQCESKIRLMDKITKKNILLQNVNFNKKIFFSLIYFII